MPPTCENSNCPDRGPRISFGIIVLNGEPFTRYCLRAIYPFAHEIIVVEGASRGAEPVATPDGHSTDGTLETLRRFKDECDPEDKLRIVTRDGPWGQKDEQSQAYANRATGDYLWQVDIDEFYRTGDMQTIMQMLASDRSITGASFRQRVFWGGFDTTVDSWSRWAGSCQRLFKLGPGYRYVTHRPPTVVDAAGVDCRRKNWLSGRRLARQGVYVYHYSLVFPRQVREKADYYATQPWGAYADGVRQWAKENFLSTLRWPFRAHNLHIEPSWLDYFDGEHPDAIEQLRADISSGLVSEPQRDNADVRAVLSLRSYRFLRWCLKLCRPLSRCRWVPGRLYLWVTRLMFDRGANRLRLRPFPSW